MQVRVLVVAVLVPTVAALAPARSGAQNVDGKWTPPTYVRELRYYCHPDKIQDQIAYYVKMAEADIKASTGRMRWVDREAYGQLVIASIPASRLEEYDTRPDSGPIFTKALGEAEWRKTLEAANAAVRRTSNVLRRFRDDLSMNRDKHTRANTNYTLYTYVTVKPGKSAQFVQASTKLIAAHKKVAPSRVISGAQTVWGEGPQFVFLSPFRTFADMEAAIDPQAAVAQAFGEAEASGWARLVEESVERVETILMQKAARDTFVP